MKVLYKSSKVIYNAHQKRYEVWYRNWFMWHFDTCYKVDEYMSSETAKELAIERAESLLNTVEVWKQSNVMYY